MNRMPVRTLPLLLRPNPADPSASLDRPRADRSWVIVFVAVLVVGLLWAAVARVAWEDYYITYRASKNLAEGHGLVFTPGERVHSFTSPLGVLLPALSYVLTGRSSDDAALWVFRVMSFSALAGAACWVWQTVRSLRPAQPWPAVVAVTWLATDSKTVTFAAGGMETGVLLFFLCWAVWACLTAPRRFVVHLGLAWAGLMWSRPDSCVYIAVLSGGLLLLSRRENGVMLPRRQVLLEIVKAGALCAVLYLPWFVWAWKYYGSPVPHTILAKGLFQDNSVGGLLHYVASLPRALWEGRTSVEYIFPPYYGHLPAQLEGMRPGLFWLATAMLLLAFVPGVSRAVRFLAGFYLGGNLYLTVVVKAPAPWYVPQVAWLGMLALVLALAELAGDAATSRWRRWSVGIISTLLVSGSLLLTAVTARQCQVTMEVVEQPVRRAVGEWLKKHAASEHDTVFLEPLGYIGFYSGLKMFDFPGLCSPEMIVARKLAPSRSYPYSWGTLIPMLRPDWLAIRPFERIEIGKNDAQLLASNYDLVKVFDATETLRARRWVPIPGSPGHDAIFEIYHRKPGAPRGREGVVFLPVALKDFTAIEALIPVEDTGNGLSAHAPSRLVLPVREGVMHLTGGFGLYDGAYTQPPPNVTDGAVFTISLMLPDGSTRELLRRALDPVVRPEDRGLQLFAVPLGAAPAGTKVEFKITSGPAGNTAFDWSYWRGLTFEVRMRRE